MKDYEQSLSPTIQMTRQIINEQLRAKGKGINRSCASARARTFRLLRNRRSVASYQPIYRVYRGRTCLSNCHRNCVG